MADDNAGAEVRLAALRIPLHEHDFGRDDEPEVGGCLVAEPAEGGGMVVTVVIRPGLAGEQRETFAQWAESRLMRFNEHGPEPDGWQKRTGDNAWQLWGRWTQMPSLD